MVGVTCGACHLWVGVASGKCNLWVGVTCGWVWLVVCVTCNGPIFMVVANGVCMRVGGCACICVYVHACMRTLV